jgi:hypothetical protein
MAAHEAVEFPHVAVDACPHVDAGDQLLCPLRLCLPAHQPEEPRLVGLELRGELPLRGRDRQRHELRQRRP